MNGGRPMAYWCNIYAYNRMPISYSRDLHIPVRILKMSNAINLQSDAHTTQIIGSKCQHERNKKKERQKYLFFFFFAEKIEVFLSNRHVVWIIFKTWNMRWMIKYVRCTHMTHIYSKYWNVSELLLLYGLDIYHFELRQWSDLSDIDMVFSFHPMAIFESLKNSYAFVSIKSIWPFDERGYWVSFLFGIFDF